LRLMRWKVERMVFSDGGSPSPRSKSHCDNSPAATPRAAARWAASRATWGRITRRRELRVLRGFRVGCGVRVALACRFACVPFVRTGESGSLRNFAWMATSRPARSSAMRSTPRSMRGRPALARPGHCFQPQPFTRSGCPPPLTQPTRAASQAAPWGVPSGRARICASRRSRDVRSVRIRLFCSNDVSLRWKSVSQHKAKPWETKTETEIGDLDVA